MLKLGQIVHFISESILIGFKAGVAFHIASTQLPKLFGIAVSGDDFFHRLASLARHLCDTHGPTLLVGVGGLVLLVAAEWLFPRRPAVLLVVVASIVVMSVTNLPARGIALLGPLPQGLPEIGFPRVAIEDLRSVAPLALACFLLSYIESISVTRTFALTHGYRVDPDQELLAIGAANLAAGIGQGFPVAAGMSQSAINDKAGARTPLAIVFTASVIALALVFVSDVFSKLPSAVLAAVVLMAVKGLVDIGELRHIWRVSRFDFRLALIACLGVLVLGILWGVLLAALISLLLLVRRAAHPYTAVLGRIPGTTQFGDRDRHPGSQILPGVLIFRVYGGILYFNVEHVQREVLDAIHRQQPPVALVVFDLSSSPTVDLSGVRMLARLHEQLTAQGIALQLAEARGAVRDLLRAEGIIARRALADPGRSIAAVCEIAATPSPR